MTTWFEPHRLPPSNSGATQTHTHHSYNTHSHSRIHTTFSFLLLLTFPSRSQYEYAWLQTSITSSLCCPRDHNTARVSDLTIHARDDPPPYPPGSPVRGPVVEFGCGKFCQPCIFSGDGHVVKVRTKSHILRAPPVLNQPPPSSMACAVVYMWLSGAGLVLGAELPQMCTSTVITA